MSHKRKNTEDSSEDEERPLNKKKNTLDDFFVPQPSDMEEDASGFQSNIKYFEMEDEEDGPDTYTEEVLVEFFETSSGNNPSFDILSCNDENLIYYSNEAVSEYNRNHKKVGFNESWRNTLTWLNSFSLDIKQNNLQDFQEFLLGVLNGEKDSPFVMKSLIVKDSQVYVAKGVFFLYAAAKNYNCNFCVFSTRRSPLCITPFTPWCTLDSSGSNGLTVPYFPTIVLLIHKDSYLGKTTYQILECDSKSRERAKQKVYLEEDHFSARKRIGSSKTKIEAFHFTNRGSVEEQMFQILKEECFIVYTQRWEKFKARKTKSTVAQNQKALFDNYIADLKKQLKSVPNGIMPKIKARLEETLSEYSKSSSWVSNMWASYAKEKEISGHDLIDQFHEEFMDFDNATESTEEEEEDLDEVTGGQKSEEDQTEEETGDGDDKVIRTVSRTLNAIIKKDSTTNGNGLYQDVLETLVQEQDKCTKCIGGSAKIVSILIEMNISGEILNFVDSQSSFQKTFFDLKTVDLSNRNFQGDKEEQIAKYNDVQRKTLMNLDLFSYANLWNFLYKCINTKARGENRLYHAIIQKLDSTDFLSFTTTPSLHDAVRQLSVNLKNMYSFDSVKKDLRTLISILLQIHLRKDRFFKDKDMDKGKQSQPQAQSGTEIRNHSRPNALRGLERAVWRQKVNVYILRNIVVKTFSVNTSDATRVSESSKPTKKPRHEPFKSDSDLPAAHVRALVAASTMLCMSDSINGRISSDYLKKRIFKDKREKIPMESYEACVKIINALRNISLKRSMSATPTSGCIIRYLKNILVIFSKKQNNFTNKIWKLYVERKASQPPIAIKVDARTLYLIFSKKYQLYKNRQLDKITSVHDIGSDKQMREAVMGNFFRTSKIRRILKEQKLDPSGYFLFKNQYVLRFAGVLTEKRLKQKTDVIEPAPPGTSSESDDSSNDPTSENMASQPETSPSTTPGDESNEEEEIQKEIERLVKEVEYHENELKDHQLGVKTLESDKRDIQASIREKKKETGYLDVDSIQTLKRRKRAFNKRWKAMMEVNTDIKQKRSRIYILSKRKSEEEKPANFLTLETRMLQVIIDKGDKVVATGLDPGVISTAVLASSTLESHFESINRYQTLAGSDTHSNANMGEINTLDWALNLTEKQVNHVNLLKKQTKQREKRIRDKKATNKKKQEKEAVTRDIRTTKFHQKFYSNYRANVCKMPGVSILNFIGNWNRVTTGMKGHTRRKLNPLLDRLDSIKSDHTLVVDEYNTTVTCSSCFAPTTKQKVYRSGCWKELQGAVVCFNDECPRRLCNNITTVNRDQNGSYNISLVGMSKVLLEGHLPLPVFDRRVYKSNSYKLCKINQTVDVHI